jgi:Flp pilus assembly protein TadB
MREMNEIKKEQRKREKHINYYIAVSGIMIIIAFTLVILFYKLEINIGVLIGVAMVMFTTIYLKIEKEIEEIEKIYDKHKGWYD